MTPKEFERVGIQLFGPKDWKAGMARALSRHPSMIWRYTTGQSPIPKLVYVVLNGMLNSAAYRECNDDMKRLTNKKRK
jgi:hypothetical protein